MQNEHLLLLFHMKNHPTAKHWEALLQISKSKGIFDTKVCEEQSNKVRYRCFPNNC